MTSWIHGGVDLSNYEIKLAKFWGLKQPVNILNSKNNNHKDWVSHEAGYDKQLCLSGPSCYVDKSQGNFSLAVPGVNAANTKFCIRLYGLDPSARWVPSDSCEHEPRTNWATESQILWGEGSSGTPGWWGHHPSSGFQTRSPWHRGAGGDGGVWEQGPPGSGPLPAAGVRGFWLLPQHISAYKHIQGYIHLTRARIEVLSAFWHRKYECFGVRPPWNTSQGQPCIRLLETV